MSTRVLGSLVVLSFLILNAAVLEAALYRRALTINNSTSTPRADFQVPVVLTPANFDYSHIEQSGQVIRFTDTDLVTPLTYYRESWIWGGTSVFWVKVPSLPANSLKTVYLHHATSLGHITPTLPDFAMTFPNRYILSAGSAILSVAPSYDWFQIDAGATAIDNTPGSPLNVVARRAIIHGTIEAKEMGHPPNVGLFTDGVWWGAGQVAPNGTAGGAGYGGQGGAGFSSSESPLPPYGTATGDDIDQGSSGATGAGPGGAGGGAVTISAPFLDMTGRVNAGGADGSAPLPEVWPPTGGGGGSGGGVLLRAYQLKVGGATITVNGGRGGPGGYGGGGGGGRIKLLYQNSVVGTPTLSASGGAGDNGAASGAAGTTHTGSRLAFEMPDMMVASVGPEEVVVGVVAGFAGGVRVAHPAPNPSRNQVAFRIDVDRPLPLRAEIVDAQGRRVRSLRRDVDLSAGAHEVVWDHRDDAGGAVPVGIYLAHITLGERTWTRRIAVVQ